MQSFQDLENQSRSAIPLISSRGLQRGRLPCALSVPARAKQKRIEENITRP